MKWPAELKERVMDLRRQGFSSYEIADAIGRSASQVRGLFRRARYLKDGSARGSVIERMTVPDDVWAERDRRVSAEMTINMALLGDPVVPRWSSNK